jgi:sodium pump decarboxylase gamma subunit
MTQDVLSLAGLTTMVGMGVVFTALFLLSIYMYIFKYLVATFEERKRRKAAPRKVAQTAAPEVGAAPSGEGVPEEEVAAIALAMHLEGVKAGVSLDEVAAIGLAMHLDRMGRPAVPADVAAVIMTALHLHMQAATAANIAAALEPEPRQPGTEGWKMAGLLESHTMRLQLQGQPRRVGAA